MSLHFLGIRDFPILHQQLTSPSAKSAKPPPSQDHTEELVQDSKDVLIQRLLDLATHLQEEGIRDGEVSRLHHDVDHMERTLHQSPLLLQEPDFQGHRSTRSFDSSRSEEDRLWGPLSPGLRSPIRFFESPRAPSNPTSAAKGISPKKAALLAEEADALLTQLTRTVGELRQRREESEASSQRPRARPVRPSSQMSNLPAAYPRPPRHPRRESCAARDRARRAHRRPVRAFPTSVHQLLRKLHAHLSRVTYIMALVRFVSNPDDCPLTLIQLLQRRGL